MKFNKKNSNKGINFVYNGDLSQNLNNHDENYGAVVGGSFFIMEELFDYLEILV